MRREETELGETEVGGEKDLWRESLALGGREATDARRSGRQRLAEEELGMFLEGSAWGVAAPGEAWHCLIWVAGSNNGAHM